MLEIIVLVKFCRFLSATAREKNRPSSWGALGAVLWIGGEISGGVLGAKGGQDGMGLYGYALFGAVIGATLAYIIVRSLTPIPDDNGLPSARIV